MAGGIELLVGLLAVLCIVALLAERFQIPEPVMLVASGALIALIPGLPQVRLDPELVLILFLPPLVYVAASALSWNDFFSNLQPITLMAVGCVIFTAVLVAYISEMLIPPLPLAAAFVLGAAIAPPDAVAATSMASRLGIPRRIVTVLEGEGVVNDATALTFYKFAVAAALTGAFSIPKAVLTFAAIVVGEIAWGFVVGRFFTWLLARLQNAPVQITVSLIVPYFAFLVPEQLGGSGVLAVVMAGLCVGRSGFAELTSISRIEGRSVWNAIRFVLEGLLFLLTGLQIRAVLMRIAERTPGELLAYGIIVSVTVILVRFLWVFPATYLPRLLSRSVPRDDPQPTWQYPFVVAFTGMRGGVSLAAALAIPLTTESGKPFPERELVVFLTFCVILFTLVLQGLTLPLVVRWLGLARHGREEEEELDRQELVARSAVLGAALDRLRSEHGGNPSAAKNSLEKEYRRRRKIVQDLLAGQRREGFAQELELRQELVDAERRSLASLRSNGEISDEVLRRVQRDIDFEEAKLLPKRRQLE